MRSVRPVVFPALQASPVNLLVDVDGTILYRGSDFEEIARLIQKRLDQLPAAK